MLSLIGLHMRRNGIANYPGRVSISIDGNGRGSQHQNAILIYRTTRVYPERPPDLYTHPQATTLAYARYWYSERTDGYTLRQEFLANPADYYQITNEASGNNPAEFQKLIAFERNILLLMEADGLRGCVGSLANNTPRSEDWVTYYAPFVVSAWNDYGAIYGRHVYGGGNLLDATGNISSEPPNNPARVAYELQHLQAIGYTGGVVLSECGIDGGYGVADYGRFRTQALGIADQLSPYAGILIGLCWWECGNTPDFRADYTSHLRQLEPELNRVFPAWQPGQTPPETPKIVIVKKPQKREMTRTENGRVNAYAWDDYGRTTTHSHDDMLTMLGAGNDQSYAVVAWPERPSQREAIQMLNAAGYRWQPWPNTPPIPPDPPPVTVDLLPYLRGDGRLYEVRNANGGQERFQTQTQNSGEFWQTKNSLAECLYNRDGFIWRDWDTSPGGGRFYRQQSHVPGEIGAKWLPRHMAIGETFAISLHVQFYNWDCSENPNNSGNVTDNRRLVAHYETWISRAGITLNDVIKIEWVNGGETYFYARGFGLVAWERTHQDPDTPLWSAISEIHEPGQRPPNVVNLPACLS